MQRLSSNYGQQTLLLDDEIPTNYLRSYLGTVHVSTTPGIIERRIRARCEVGKFTEEQTEQTVKAALWIHRENRLEYQWVMKV